MADLVERLLQTSSPSQLSAILSGYLETSENKRNADFYYSLKSVLIPLKKHDELPDETICRIYRDYCLPVLCKNLIDRVLLYSVYDVIVLCCTLGPKSLSQELIASCLASLSNYSNELASPTGLPVLVSLDLVSCLLKGEARAVVDEDSRGKLFNSLLDVLCMSDELMCARISSGILPLFIIQDNGTESSLNAMTLWTRVKEMVQVDSMSANSTLGNLQKYYATMCSLIDIFLMDSSAGGSILHESKFWELIQQGLKQQDPLLSKRAMYLLQRSLDHIEKRRMSLRVKDEHGRVVFYWEPKEEKLLLEFWQEFVLLIETLSETQVHVIKPVLTKFSKIVTATELTCEDSRTLHISWLTTIIYKASLHPSRILRKWAALEIMTLDLSKSPLLHPQNWDFILGHFQTMLSEYNLFSKDHDGIAGTLSPVKTALHSFYKNCFEWLPKDLHVEFMRRLIISIEEQRFSAAPLACIFNSLANIPSLPLLGEDSLQRIRNILLHLRTHAVNLRLATKGFIVMTIVNLTDPSLVSWDAIFNLINVGRLDECLQRKSWLWVCLCSWIWSTVNFRHEIVEGKLIKDYEKEGLIHFLLAKVDNFLKDQQVHQNCMNDEAASLSLFIISVADSFHLHNNTTCDLPQVVLNVLFQNFHDASTRPYMSESRLCKAVSLLTSMLQVIDGSHSDTANESHDHTKELITSSLKHSLTDILNLLQRKLVSSECDGMSTGEFPYLKLSQTLHHFCSTNPTMRSCWEQFYTFLERITMSNIKTIQGIQGYSNYGNQQWSAMHQSMLLIAWVCDVITDNHMTIPQSVTKLVLDAVPTFRLDVEFKTPEAACIDKSSYQGAVQTIATLRNSVSGYLGALWRTVAYYLQQNTTKIQSTHEDGLTITSCTSQVLEVALEALNVTSSDNVMSIMTSIGLLIPKLLDGHVELCSRALDAVWATFVEMWDHPSFWEICLTTANVVMSPTLLMLPEEHPLTAKVKARLGEMMTEGEFRHGITNVVIHHLGNVWTKEMNSCTSSIQVYKELIVEILLYNASIQKTHVIDAHVDAFLRHNLSTQSPLCTLRELEKRDDTEVRVTMTNILLSLDASDSSVHEVLFQIIRLLMSRDDEISVANPKMYANSRSHRKKHHAWQAILVLLPLIIEQDPQGACSEEVLRYTFASLECANQVSVQNYQQWVILYILNRYPNMAPLLWKEFNHDSEKRVGRISLLATVAMLFVIHCVADSTKRPVLFKHAISAVLPWISVNHRQARVHAQLALQRMWCCCVCENLELVLKERELIEPCLEFMMTNNDTLAEKVKLFENYFFFDFNPIGDFSMETIYYTIPKQSGVSEEEWIQPKQFQEKLLGMRLWSSQKCYGIPLYNEDRRLANFVAESYNYRETFGAQLQCRIRGEKPPSSTNTPDAESHDIPEGGDVQKKITAWKIVPPDEMMIAELQQQRMLSLQKSSGGNLIVVASLIDKAPNLGGLCRTSEIFGVKKLVLGSNEIMKDKNFKTLSVSSSKWVDVEQVRPQDLKEYLQKMQQQGYILIGVEQTANSKPLTEYTFPHNALLLLGNEKEGIPADLIQLLDVCVEIPQVGVIRSLNVHVSGALLIWEYTRQRVLSGGNSAD